MGLPVGADEREVAGEVLGEDVLVKGAGELPGAD